MLHTLYGQVRVFAYVTTCLTCRCCGAQAVKHNTVFFIEYFALDLIMHNGA